MNKKNEFAGILWTAAAIFMFAALLPFELFGLLGKYLRGLFYLVFGFVSFLFPVILGAAGWYSFTKNKVEKPAFKTFGTALFLTAFCLLDYLSGIFKYCENGIRPTSDSNQFGILLGGALKAFAGTTGIWFLAVLILITGIYLLEVEEYPKNWLSRLLLLLKTRIHAAGRSLKEKQAAALEKKAKKEIIIPTIPNPPQAEDKKKTEKIKFGSTGQLKERIAFRKTTAVSRGFKLPGIELLSPKEIQDKTKENTAIKAEIIKKTLQTFDIEVEIMRAIVGPRVSRYEVKPSAGTKISKIANLSNDLALNLKAQHIRIIAPLPGVGAVGIEVPNEKQATVTMSELLEAKDFRDPDLRIPVAIGKTVDGEDIISDLAGMPHLLVAGSTGSGKSVCLNALIMSMLYKFDPTELKLLLIDPKRVEFTLYRDLPHLYTPIITEAKKATAALKAVSIEMKNRYDKLSEIGVRDIVSYNQVSEEKMPYIVIIIDELADLMILGANEVEEVITRLAQLARGVGIHLVFATQRPSVDVLTGVIKANFPSRIALQVFSRTDSRVILDTGGAEDLLGKGDMLFSHSSFPQPERAQCPFLSSAEIKKVMDFWKAQGKPAYGMLEPVPGDDGFDSPEGEDAELFRNALQIVIERKRASATLFKGALHISDGKAADLISRMEMKGLIGPSMGSKPRDIYGEKIEAIIAKNENKNKNL